MRPMRREELDGLKSNTLPWFFAGLKPCANPKKQSKSNGNCRVRVLLMWFVVVCGLGFCCCHVGRRFCMGDGFGGEGEGSFFFYFVRGADEGSEGGSGEGAAYADSFDSGSCEVFDGEGCALQACEDVDGFRNRGAYLTDCFESGESGSVEDIGAGLGE